MSERKYLPEGSNYSVSRAAMIMNLILAAGFFFIMICVFADILFSNNGAFDGFLGNVIAVFFYIDLFMCIVTLGPWSIIMPIYLAVHFLFENGRYLVLIEAVIVLVSGIIGVWCLSFLNFESFHPGFEEAGIFMLTTIVMSASSMYHYYMARKPGLWKQAPFGYLKCDPYESKAVLSVLFSVLMFIDILKLRGLLWNSSEFSYALSSDLFALILFAGMCSVGILQVEYYRKRERNPLILTAAAANIAAGIPTFLLIWAIEGTEYAKDSLFTTISFVILLLLLLVSAAVSIYQILIMRGVLRKSRH